MSTSISGAVAVDQLGQYDFPIAALCLSLRGFGYACFYFHGFFATGVKLTNPAQDPVAFSTASDLSVLNSKQNQYSTNIDNATGKIQVQESTLGSITTMLQSVRDVAIQANNAAQNGTSLSALTDQLDQLQKALAGQMNATDERGEYLFSGTAAREKPYDASGQLNPALDSTSPSFQNVTSVKLAISDQQSVAINQPAGQIFQLSSSATTGGNASIHYDPARKSPDYLSKCAKRY
ncbi:MAG: hypothetical protein B7X28_08340 [Halothiobacillus sp. 13-55-253]|nr:MAG: hypothetical protein B7X28_08340 [Halothiobacillus sp. 13-55-253]